MRYAVVSDLHANLEAALAVFERISRLDVDAVACLGDIVGYHANPNEVVDLVRDNVCHVVAGNHDRASTAAAVPEYFSGRARAGVEWTRGQFARPSATYLETLPVSLRLDERVLLLHGAAHPVPNEHVRLSDEAAAASSFAALEQQFPEVAICFFGHIHLPLAYAWRDGLVTKHLAQRLQLEAGVRYLVCPGSVGQPRDGDPRSAFLVFDGDRSTVEFHRVPYDRRTWRRKAEAAGLMSRPKPWRRAAGWLARRLR